MNDVEYFYHRGEKRIWRFSIKHYLEEIDRLNVVRSCSLRHRPEYCLNCDGLKICHPLGFFYSSRPLKPSEIYQPKPVCK